MVNHAFCWMESWTPTPMDLILGLQERRMQQTNVQYNFVSIMSYLFSRLLDIELVYYSKFCFYPVSE
jgi:hypothetical protein